MIKLYRYDTAQMSDAEYERLAAAGSDELRARLDRMAHTDDRKRTLAGHLLILGAAKELCGASDPVILRTAAGKPYFAALPIRFSLSHSEDKVILAVSDREIGADIERIRPLSLGVAKRFFTPAEQAYVFGKVPTEQDLSLPKEAQDGALLRRFYEVWTKKEAYGKWQGSGMSAALSVDTAALSFYTENDGEYALAVYEQ
ncbi:MAG: 4'-phosphopantetheinyl transferase superfamily protein [Clostridia bacterium]|nr:4'-phosphopantetheinyl transferase superfamily protein [Clostridia bacterium]